MRNFSIELQMDDGKWIQSHAAGDEFTVKIWQRDKRWKFHKMAVIIHGGSAEAEGVSEIVVESPLVAESRFYVFGGGR